MGIYLNPSNENFKLTLAAPIYVDKTMMIAAVNRFIDQGNHYICVSRPRRFGKTIAGNMLSAYYSKGCDSRELFASFKISADKSFGEKLNQYNVIKIDLNGMWQNTRDKEHLIIILEDKVKEEMREEYPNVPIKEYDSLADSILKIYKAGKGQFIIFIDEYDVLIREEVPEDMFASYLSMLNGLFKDDTLRPAIALAYLTGIMPVVRDRVQSKLNNFREYTIIKANELAEFVGFTSEEVESLCEEYDMDIDECKRWYNGYHQKGIDIYNPESVVRAMENHECDGFWNMTSTYAAITDRIEYNFEGTKDAVIRMLAGEEVDVNVTKFRNTMDSFKTRDDVFTYLIYIGYLAYDYEKKTCRIPNWEIRQEWINVVEDGGEYAQTDKIIRASKELLSETLAGNEEAVAKALDESHIHVTSNRSYNNEDALQSAIYLAYIYALNEYTIVREMTTGKEFADVVFIPFVPERPAMIIELKRNDTADSAVNQIKEKRYFDSLEKYQGDLLFVGINYDEKDKTHTCQIEKYQK